MNESNVCNKLDGCDKCMHLEDSDACVAAQEKAEQEYIYEVLEEILDQFVDGKGVPTCSGVTPINYGNQPISNVEMTRHAIREVYRIQLQAIQTVTAITTDPTFTEEGIDECYNTLNEWMSVLYDSERPITVDENLDKKNSLIQFCVDCIAISSMTVRKLDKALYQIEHKHEGMLEEADK